MTLHDTLSEIVASAPTEGVDAVTLVKDYFDEKDSHFSRERVKEILKRHGLMKGSLKIQQEKAS